MTRRGTLAYYLAAWVIGCFVLSVMAWVWASPQEGIPLAAPARLLILYFLSLAYGAVDMLLFAFLLRGAMRLWGTHALWAWIIVGACNRRGSGAVAALVGRCTGWRKRALGPWAARLLAARGLDRAQRPAPGRNLAGARRRRADGRGLVPG